MGEKVNPKMNENIKSRRARIVKLLNANPDLTQSEIAKKLRISIDTVSRDIFYLGAKGKIPEKRTRIKTRPSRSIRRKNEEDKIANHSENETTPEDKYKFMMARKINEFIAKKQYGIARQYLEVLMGEMKFTTEERMKLESLRDTLDKMLKKDSPNIEEKDK